MSDPTVDKWLASLGLEQYGDAFRENDVDSRAIPYLSDQDLKEMGVSLGHRRVLLSSLDSISSLQRASSESGEKAPPVIPGEPERRQLSVMFCDIVNSTELTRNRDPEDMRELLRTYQDLVGESVRRFGGYIARFTGDGILAYFGWPQAYEDQAERAVRASMDAADAVAQIILDEGGVLETRFGIDSGEVIVGDIVGQETSDTQTVTGLSPNLAARLQSVAGPGQVVIGPSTRDLIGSSFELVPFGEHKFKGFPDRVPAWLVRREVEAESRFEAVRGSTRTRLVGRDHELGLLQDRWDLAREGEGQVALLAGEAGIGKSRIVQSFIARIGSGSHYNLYYQCSPYHTNSPFYPVVQRLKRAARFSPTDSVEEKLSKLDQLLLQIDQQDNRTGALLADLLSLPAEHRYGTLDLTPQQLRQRTVEMLSNQMLHLASQRPVVCILEDVHWIDPSMSEFMSDLIPRITDMPVYVLATYRPEKAAPWSNHPHATSITINRLGKKQAAKIAYSIAGEDLIGAIIEQIVNRADGVPLYIEELTKSVVETYSGGDESVLDDLIPASLQSSLIARLDYLGEAKNVAQMGSIIGREFSYELIREISGLDDGELDEALDRLVSSGMVFKWGRPPDTHYTFKHALIHDAAYNTILNKRRQDLHRRIFDILETGDDIHSREQTGALAFHSYNGRIWGKAFHYYQQAGRMSMDQAAIREAVDQFEHALEAARQLPETRESLEQAIDLRFDLRNAMWAIAAFEEILDNLAQAEKMARRLDDKTRTGWISVFGSASMWQLGRAREAEDAARKALEINGGTDLSLEVGGLFYLGCATVTSGRCIEAEPHFQKISDMLVGELSTDRCGLPFVPAVISRSWLVWALAERGEFDLADQYGEEALEIAKKVGNPFNLAHVYYDLGYCHQVRGNYEQAVEALENAMYYVREWSLTYLSPFITGFYGHSRALSGDHDDGIALLEKAVSLYESMGLGLFRALVRIQLGEAYFLANHLDRALATTAIGLKLAQTRHEQGHEAYAHRLLGEITARQDPLETDDSIDHLKRSLSLAEKHGMRPLQAHCHKGIADLMAEGSDERKVHAGNATDLFAELGMTL